MDKVVLSMASIRIISGAMELIAACIMLRLNSTEKALLVNAGLAFVGPLIFMATMTIGFVSISHKLSWDKIGLIVCGVAFIMLAILKK